jgi:hypothetical protein
MMERVPEEMLREVLARIVTVTSGGDAKSHRQTAVRWFNRLCYDVRKWNEGFICFMNSYQRGGPGAKEKYKEYVTSLENPYGEVKNELCRNLEILNARFHKDFAWLRDKDQSAYSELENILAASYRSEYKIIYCAHQVTTGHMQLDEYERQSSRMVNDLHEFARKAGVMLLDISEYEEILQTQVSVNPLVLLIGDNYNISGSQVGAVGHGAQVHDTTMTQHVSLSAKVGDLKALADELAALREAMRHAAKEPEEDSAVANVAKAKKAAEQGDASGVLKYLRAAGKWALQTATTIGTKLAENVLEIALGIK